MGRAVRREWRSGDRLQIELPLPLRLQSVDREHPDTVALLAGPLVLMRLLGQEPGPALSLAPNDLLSTQRTGATAHQWRLNTPVQTVELRPFMDISGERYSVYQDVRHA